MQDLLYQRYGEGVVKGMIIRILQAILKFFQKPRLPHPEEPPDYTQTLESVDVYEVLDAWILGWSVPLEYEVYWRKAIVITVTLTIGTPAQTWTDEQGKRHLDIRPEWLNPGVVAHEQGHNSWALLTEEQKQNFSVIFMSLKKSDRSIKYLFSVNPYGLSSDVEGHAECYRFLGSQIPESLKPFYPRLF